MNRIISFLFFALFLAACAFKTAEPSGEFAIYLPAEQMSGGEILTADLSKLRLKQPALIAANEIVAYAPGSHNLQLKPEAVERLAIMKAPMNGIGFVACLGKTPIFAGAIWTPLSSLSFEGVTIQTPLGVSSTQVHLYSGYPSVDDPLPNDPRDDPRLLQALKLVGKLR